MSEKPDDAELQAATSETDDVAALVLKALRYPDNAPKVMTTESVAEASGLDRETASEAIAALFDDGRLIKYETDEKDFYTLPLEPGQEHLRI
jgi:predicted transcriptional regulator